MALPNYIVYVSFTGCRTKRNRSIFSRTVLQRLEKAFKTTQYLTSEEREQLALSTGLTETKIKIWFQNRRTKQKREERDQAWKYYKVPVMLPSLIARGYIPRYMQQQHQHCECCYCSNNNSSQQRDMYRVSQKEV